jgi:hypothetical protein
MSASALVDFEALRAKTLANFFKKIQTAPPAPIIFFYGPYLNEWILGLLQYAGDVESGAISATECQFWVGVYFHQWGAMGLLPNDKNAFKAMVKYYTASQGLDASMWDNY